MRNLNLENVEENMEFKKVTAGGYIAEIKSVFDNTAKEYLEIELDIAEGEFKGNYKDLYEKKGFWGLVKRASYKENALPFFKGMITATEESNPGYKFAYDEKTLIGKRVGIVLGEEEYVGNDGSTKTRLYIDRFRNTKAILENDYKVPELKKLKEEVPTFEDVIDDDELPFK